MIIGQLTRVPSDIHGVYLLLILNNVENLEIKLENFHEDNPVNTLGSSNTLLLQQSRFDLVMNDRKDGELV